MKEIRLPLPTRVLDEDTYRSIPPHVKFLYRIRSLVPESEVPSDRLLQMMHKPENMPSSASLKSDARQIFSHPLKSDYIRSYKASLSDYFGFKKAHIEKTPEEIAEDYDKWAARFKEQVPAILDKMMSSENGDEQLEAIKLFFSKVMKDSDDDAVELPRRYLPVMCSNCTYKVFVHDNCVNVCDRCRYRVEMGYRGIEYDHKEQLLSDDEMDSKDRDDFST